MSDLVFQGGTADWFAAGSWLPQAMPEAGDTLTIGTGTATISAADVVNFGSLDDEQLFIGSPLASTAAGFAADGASFGAGFTIASTAAFASLSFSGLVGFAGSMNFTTADGLVSLGIAADATHAGALDLAGTITITNGDSLTIDGGSLDLTGLIDVTDGLLTIGPDTTLLGDGTITVGAGGTVVIDGPVSPGMTIDFQGASGTLDLADPLRFHGAVTGFVTGDRIDLLDAPADDWSYDGTSDVLTVYSGDENDQSNPVVAAFSLTSSATLTSRTIYVGSDGNGGSLVLLSNTRRWVGDSGDWYTTRNWTTDGTLTPNSYPLYGDTAIIETGTATISAADFVQYGTLDDELIRLDGANAALRVTDGALGPDLRIYSEASQADTTLVADGTVTSQGLIRISADNSALNLVVGSDGTAAGDFVIDNFGSIVVSDESAFDLVSGRLTNDGNIVINGAALVAAEATIDGSGVLDLNTSGITLDMAGSIGPSQQVSFYDNTLLLERGAEFDGIIEDFANGDTIDLQGTVANYASYDAGTSALTLRDGGPTGTVVASFNVTGNYGPGDFAATSDGDGGTFITDTVTHGMRIFYSALPAPAVATTGDTVSLDQLLVDSFGTSALSLPDVQLASDSPSDMGYFSYWDPNDPLLSYWTLNGTAITPDNLETVPQSAFADVDYVAGNAIQANATIQIPIACDDQGTPTAADNYVVQNFETPFAQPSLTTGAPTPQDVVAAAKAFAAAYTGVPNTEDCYNIAHEVAAAAGATMVQNTGSTDPEENVAGGFWRIAYAAPQNDTAVSNWSTLVEAGDILRIGWSGTPTEPHSFTVVAPLDARGKITVFDNIYYKPGYEAIGIHKVQYWNQTNAEDITIFRLDPNDLYLVDDTKPDGSLVQDLPNAIMQGSTFNNLIIPSGHGDTIIGGSGENVIADTAAILNGATIADFHAGDTIDLTDLDSSVTSASYDAATGLLDIISNNATVAALQLPGNLAGSFDVNNDGGTADLDGNTLGTIYNSLFTGVTADGSAVTLVTCFAQGTHIATPSGAVPVERLAIGDLVVCADGQAQAIAWIGWRSLDIARHPQPAQVLPVRIAPDAFAEGVPKRPLLLSPDHAVFAEGVLIPIRYLVNGRTVAQLPAAAMPRITYYHIELPAHDIVLAEDLPVESYLDTGNRDRFSNGGRSVMLFPDFSPLIWDATGYAPLRVMGAEVEAVRRHLQRRTALSPLAPEPQAQAAARGGRKAPRRTHGAAQLAPQRMAGAP